ncbi:protein kinase [Streptomyces sp. NPDC002138]|uniref:protein kinase domain-containing protein n=1 Tax=Streptomyces sp. NPDC002138 TaxID=3154410 RepID=UPI00331EE9D9
MHDHVHAGGVRPGRYVLGREPIASGGMGTVWRGYDGKLKRAVAVKELRFAEGLNESERARQKARVMVEARAAACLDHPGIVPVYDVIEDDGRPWIVMRLVPGRSLAQEVEASGALSPQRTAEIGPEILAALEAAHAGRHPAPGCQATERTSGS